ncbi:MAG: hypothetical protein BGO12_13150 [Verrucomicrobia bacterium 61-8]|nr:MAG: hypothetical protein BGO12_13150 [Verrucomicrobia bacterium 61-8]
MKYTTFFLSLLSACSLAVRAEDASNQPKEIGPDDANIHYVGRFDTLHGAPRCSWPNSAVVVRFDGTDLSVNVREKRGLQKIPGDFWQVVVDGEPTDKINLEDGEHIYSLASGLAPGQHTVEFVKADQSMHGITQILGFRLDKGGKLLPTRPLPKRMEIIGDSISCGVSIEGEPETPESTNAYFSYGAITARNIGAELMNISWSGKTLDAVKGMPAIYERIVPEYGSKWDYAKWIPDIIVINLSTNDYLQRMIQADTEKWIAGYKTFVARLRGYYPNAQIYCLTSPMLQGDRHTSTRDDIDRVVGDLAAAGDKNIHLVDINPMPEGIRGHPDRQVHEEMAKRLTEAIKGSL